jgi:hypothetical protein
MAESQVLAQDPAQGGSEAVAVGVGHFDRTVCGVSRLAVLIDVLGLEGNGWEGLKSSPLEVRCSLLFILWRGVWLYLLYIVTYKFYRVTLFLLLGIV